MKKCNNCGNLFDEETKFCPTCGSAQPVDKKTSEQQLSQEQTRNEAQNVNLSVENNSTNGNIISGIVGAFLFSLIGGLLYFVVYQIGFIAGICGLVIFVLANFGYGLFAKPNSKNSIIGLIVSIIATITMIFFAEYFCLSFEIFQVYKEELGITIFDAIRATPEFLSEPEISKSVAEEVSTAYIFGFFASIGNIVGIVKDRKKEKQLKEMQIKKAE